MTTKSALQMILKAILYTKEEERQPNHKNIRQSSGNLWLKQLKIESQEGPIMSSISNEKNLLLTKEM